MQTGVVLPQPRVTVRRLSLLRHLEPVRRRVRGHAADRAPVPVLGI